jgi:hypothetical protein
MNLRYHSNNTFIKTVTSFNVSNCIKSRHVVSRWTKRSPQLIRSQLKKKYFTTSKTINTFISTLSHQTIDSSLQERGIFDERNLLKFDTIHELQSNASIAFADNPLFGKYVKPEGQDAKFEYMTYRDFGRKVDTCRALLKDLGMSNCKHCCTLSSYFIMLQFAIQ